MNKSVHALPCPSPDSVLFLYSLLLCFSITFSLLLCFSVFLSASLSLSLSLSLLHTRTLISVSLFYLVQPNDLGIRNATLPYLSPSVPIEGREEFDVIVYVDALTIPSWTDAKTESRTPESHG